MPLVDVVGRTPSIWTLGALVETAARLRVERRVETYVVTADGPRMLGDLTPDALLELASEDE